MNQQAIVATHLSIMRGKQAIIRDLTMYIRPGRIVGLIGPSGAGKTTLMRAIVGVQRLSGGELTVLGERAGTASLRRRIGYVTQTPAIYGDLTVEQNLRYFAQLVRASRQDVSLIIDKVQLSAQRHQLVDSLSGGQKARVSLAVALLGQPDLLVLDEPTVGLDPLLRAELWDMFAGLAAEGKTLLVSSHVMDEAERCDDLVLLRDGQVLWNDSRVALLEATSTDTVGAAFITAIRQRGASDVSR
jgi:ABC-2 type transport system ATP-binding protein